MKLSDVVSFVVVKGVDGVAAQRYVCRTYSPEAGNRQTYNVHPVSPVFGPLFPPVVPIFEWWRRPVLIVTMIAQLSQQCVEVLERGFEAILGCIRNLRPKRGGVL